MCPEMAARMRNQTRSPARNFGPTEPSISANTSISSSASIEPMLCCSNLRQNSPITPTSDFVCSDPSFHDLDSSMSSVHSVTAHASSIASYVHCSLVSFRFYGSLNTARHREVSGTTCAELAASRLILRDTTSYSIARDSGECV